MRYEPLCGDARQHACHLYWPQEGEDAGRIAVKCLGVSRSQAGVFAMFTQLDRIRDRVPTGVLEGFELEAGKRFLSAVRRTLAPSFAEVVAPFKGDPVAREIGLPVRERKDMGEYEWRIVAASGEVGHD